MEEGGRCFAYPECCARTESCCVARLTRRLAGTNSECPADLPSIVHGNVPAIRLESIYNQRWVSIDFRMSARPEMLCGRGRGRRDVPALPKHLLWYGRTGYPVVVVRQTRADPSCQKAMVQWFGKFGDAKH